MFGDIDTVWLTSREKELADQLALAEEENTKLLRTVSIYEKQDKLQRYQRENAKLKAKILVLSGSDDSGHSASESELDVPASSPAVTKVKPKKSKKSRNKKKPVSGAIDQTDASESEGSSQVKGFKEQQSNCEYHFLHCKDDYCICKSHCQNTCMLSGLINSKSEKAHSLNRHFGHAETGDGWRKSRQMNGEKASVAWTHRNLGPRYCVIDDDEVSFSDLDLRLFVAGELNIISSKHIGEKERFARIELLSDMVFNAGHYQWDAVLKLYSAILTRIGDGEIQWGDASQFHRMEQMLLMPFPLARQQHDQRGSLGRRGRDSERPKYCSEFQKNECGHMGDHMGKFFGEHVLLRHICSKCLKEDGNIMEHPSSALDCPHHG